MTNFKEKIISSFLLFENTLKGGLDSKFHELRLRALNYFKKHGFPTTKDEDWKYTNISPLLKHDYEISSLKKNKVSLSNLKKNLLLEKDTYKLVFVDGVFNPELSASSLEEYFICSLSDAKKTHPEILETHLGKIASFKKNSFCAINTAFTNQGAFIYVPKGVVVTKPIQIMWLTSNTQKIVFNQPRVLIVAEENARIQIVERHQSPFGINALSNSVCEVFCNNKSWVDYYKIQNDDKNASLFDSTYVHQKKQSVCNITTLSLGGKFTRNYLHFELSEERIEANLNGISLIGKGQFVDHHTFVDHQSPNCNSNELYKGIFNDNAKGVFNGKVMVRPDAQKTNAFQQNNNIILTDEASVDTKPQLEIFADDVKCSHGCTIGQLDKEALFYLQSRGIARKEATALLLFAFKNDVMNHVKIPTLKDKLNKLIAKKLNVSFEL